MNGLTVIVMAVGMVGWSLLAVAVVGGIAGPILAQRYHREAVRDSDEGLE
jgi:hypothetical protein